MSKEIHFYYNIDDIPIDVGYYLEIGEEPPGIEKIKNNFIDNFFADKSDYLDANRIKVYFV